MNKYGTSEKEELAWAGGFFSGEGCTVCHIHKTRNERPYPFIHINQIHEEELIRFNDAIGNLGNVIGPYIKKSNKLSKKPMWAINCYGYEKTKHILEMLWPYLSKAKQEQGLRVINQCKEYHEDEGLTIRY